MQYGEAVDTTTTAFQKGYRNIAEISRERLRRAIKTFASEPHLPCMGFESLKLDRSNFRKWTNYEGADSYALGQLFESLETPFVDGWTHEGVLTEVMLTEGFPLDSEVSQADEFGGIVRKVKHPELDLTLLLCLDETLEDDIIAKLEGFEHTVFVCRESALTDQLKLQLAEVITVKTL